MWMAASNELICFLVWPVPETAMGILCNYVVSALPCTPYVMRSHSPCTELFSTPHKLPNSTTSYGVGMGGGGSVLICCLP